MNTETAGMSSQFRWSSDVLHGVGVSTDELAVTARTISRVAGEMREVLIPVGAMDVREPLRLGVWGPADYDVLTATVMVSGEAHPRPDLQPIDEVGYRRMTLAEFALPRNLPRRTLIRVTVFGRSDRGDGSGYAYIFLP